MTDSEMNEAQYLSGARSQSRMTRLEGLRELELIAHRHGVLRERARRELHDPRGQRGPSGYPPGPEAVQEGYYPVPPVVEEDVYGEAHPEGVYGAARGDDHRLSLVHAVPAEQALHPLGRGRGNLRGLREQHVLGPVR